MRSLSATTALLTSLALAVPVTFPAARPAAAQSGDDPVCVVVTPGGDCIEPEGIPNREAGRAERQQEQREQRQEARREARQADAADADAEALTQEAEQDVGGEEGNVTSAEELAERLRTLAAPDQPAPEAESAPSGTATSETATEATEQEEPAAEPRQTRREMREMLRREASGEAEVEAEAEIAEPEAEAVPQVEEQPAEQAEQQLREQLEQQAPQADAPQADAPLTAQQLRQQQRQEQRADERRAERQRLRQEAEAAGALDEATADQSAAGDGMAEAPSDAEIEAAAGIIMETLAGSGEGEVVEEETRRVTDRNVRRSSDGFVDADTRRQERRERREDARVEDDDNNDVRNILGGIIVGAAGAMIVGSLLRDNREVVSTAPDRVVVRDQYGNLQVLRDDDSTLRQPGSEVTTRRYADGSSESIVIQEDGTQILTVRDSEARVVRRVHIGRDGLQTVLFDDTVQYQPVVVSQLPPPNRTQIPQVDYRDQQALRQALMTPSSIDRSFSLNQIRQIDRVRYLAPAVQVENITFPSGSAAVSASEAQGLLSLGQLMAAMIEDNPNEVFLIEGHTDAVGSAVMNLTLSDRRAESVARALTEYFGVPPQNMVLQGYGETDLRVATEAAERLNRRVVVRRLTPLLQVAQAN